MTRSGNPVTLPEGVDLSAYRIVQEALSNAMRHAPGSHVQVHVAYRAGSLALANADLKDNSNIAQVQDSAVVYKNAVFHFIRVDG